MKFSVSGLSCASCVGHLQKALLALDGVASANVNLATHQAEIDFGPPATAASVSAACKAAGYPAEEFSHVLSIDGASCASCVAGIEDALDAVPGVLKSSMNLATGRANVSTLAGAVDPKILSQAVTDRGYAVLDHAADSRPEARISSNGEATAVLKSFLLAALLTLPIFAVEMGGHLFPAIHGFIAATIGMQTSHVLQFVITTAILLGPGRGFFAKGIPALMRRHPDMNSLIAIGAFAAWAYSTVVTFAPEILPLGTRNVYFESAAVIVTLILLGRYMEARAKGRTGDAIKGLLALQPDTATTVQNGQPVVVSLAEVTAGDTLMLKPGESVAVDGVVLSGVSFLDESMITGEPMPVEKSTGDALTGGSINGNGSLTYRATAVGSDTALARIVAMVEDAQGAKLPIQGMVDRITAWFVPAVIALAVLTAIGWLVFGPAPALSFALVASVSVLIIACPCAMGLATPTSIMVGTGRGAELGVLFRRGDALQALQNVRVVAFDKTGTLTKGAPQLTDLILADGLSEAEILPILAAVEDQSEHPIAQTVADAARVQSMALPEVKEFAALTGNGVQAIVNNQKVLIGADRLMRAHDIDIDALAQKASGLAAQGKTPFFAAIDGQAVAALAVADPVKETSIDAIQALHGMGFQVAMLTGDNSKTAEFVAAELGVDHVQAELLPDGKVDALNRLRASHGAVAFVGDGINDAPALASADVGLAVGTGTDIAIGAADVVLMSDDLNGVTSAFEISRNTMTNIRQNLVWAFGYNIILIPVAAGVIYPLSGVLLSPALAAGAMALSSVFVVMNSLRLRFVSPVRKV